MFIYLITNDVNASSYVGLHSGNNLRERWLKHLRDSRKGLQGAIYRAMRKHGVEKFHIASVWSGHVPIGRLKELERYFIRSFQTRAPNGYNLTDGGDGFTGGVHSSETKLKMSQSAKGKRNALGCKRSEAFKLRVSRFHRGRKRRPMSAEQRQRISNFHRGRKQNPETVRKRNEAVKKAWAEGKYANRKNGWIKRRLPTIED